MEFRHKQVSVSSGELHVVFGGASGAPTLLFLHGWPEDWSAFESVMVLAAPTANVVAIDLPGIGDLIVRNLHPAKGRWLRKFVPPFGCWD